MRQVTTHYIQIVPFDLQRAERRGAIVHYRAVQACLNYELSSQVAFRRRRSAYHSWNPNRVREESISVRWIVSVKQPARQRQTM